MVEIWAMGLNYNVSKIKPPVMKIKKQLQHTFTTTLNHDKPSLMSDQESVSGHKYVYLPTHMRTGKCEVDVTKS